MTTETASTTVVPISRTWAWPRSSLVTATVARLLLVPVIAVSFDQQPWVTAVALVAFITADIFDGALARRSGEDDVTRRALDSIIDRIAIDSCLVVAAVAGPMPAAAAVALLCRDLACALVCAALLRRRRVVLKADAVYRGLNLSVAAWALCAPLISASLAAAAAWVLVLLSLLVMYDLARCTRNAMRSSAPIDGMVVGMPAARHDNLHELI